MNTDMRSDLDTFYLTMTDQQKYERVVSILGKLTPEELDRGARTFEDEGITPGVSFYGCFIARLYGAPGEYMGARTTEYIGDFRSVRERVPALTDADCHIISHLHFGRPEMVFHAVSDLMNQ